MLLRVHVAKLGSCPAGTAYVVADIGEPADAGLSNLSDSSWVRLVYRGLHHLRIIRLFSASYHRWKDLSLVFKSYMCPCLYPFSTCNVPEVVCLILVAILC